MDFKKCTVCKEVKALSEFSKDGRDKSGIRAQCKTCQYKVQSKHYYQEKYKAQAKEKARQAYQQGKIKKPLFCPFCGENKPLDRHHPDYSKPLKIIWACRKCHRKLKSA